MHKQMYVGQLLEYVLSNNVAQCHTQKVNVSLAVYVNSNLCVGYIYDWSYCLLRFISTFFCYCNIFPPDGSQ